MLLNDLKKLIQIRGYKTLKITQQNDILTDIEYKYYIAHNNETNKTLCIIHIIDPNIIIKTINMQQLLLFFNNIKNLKKRFLLITQRATHQAISIIEDILNIRLEILSFNDIQFNNINNYLIPIIKLLDSKSKDNILKKYDTNINNFPKIICGHDTIAKYYGILIGDMIEIKSKIGNSIRIEYRIGVKKK